MAIYQEKHTHVATIAINQTVGDWTGNKRRIKQSIAVARERGARLLVFPEMVISGYSLGDRLLMNGTLERSWQMVEELREDSEGCILVLGLPIRHRDVLYNAAIVVASGKIWGIVPKENLATGDVEYENRWYSSWPRTRVEQFTSPKGEKIPIGGLIFAGKGIGGFAIEICEDGWRGIRPGSAYALAGAQIIANPSASWFTIGKHRIRRNMVEQISREDHCAYLYTSLMGCDATRLVFDGSMFIAVNGSIEKEGRRFLFHEEFEIIDQVIDVKALKRCRSEEGAWRQQSDKLLAGEYGAIPTKIIIEGDFSSLEPLRPVDYYWRSRIRTVDPSLDWMVERGLVRSLQAEDIAHLELELALSLGLREYVQKCGIPKIALALSGGRDSAMCAILVARMVRYGHPDLSEEECRQIMQNTLVTAYMGTDNSGSATRHAAKVLAEEIGAVHYDGAIQETMNTHLKIIKEMTGITMSWDNPAHDIPMQNVQARLRGGLIWTIANLHNALLISTSNKSEAAVGYTTMDGDTSGGLSPIADVPKSLIIEWLDWVANFHNYSSISTVNATPSTAELRPQEQEQTDEGDLMPFFILDQLSYYFVQMGYEPLSIFKILWPSLKEHYNGKPKLFSEHIKLFVRKLCFAQWKRERFAISFRVTAYDLDPKTGFRFPPVQSPFREEIAELEEYISMLEQGEMQ